MPLLSTMVTNFFQNPPNLIAEMGIRAGDLQATGQVLGANNNQLGPLPRLDAVNIANAIQNMRTNVGAHRDMLTLNQTWRDLYQVANRQILYYNGLRNVESVPCEACGICLPLNHIEVDHQRPKAGGELLAIAKVLRTLGLTVAAPKGRKGQSLHARYLHAPALFTVRAGPAFAQPRQPKGVAVAANWAPTPILPNTPKASRYTTNAVGTAFISLISHMDQDLQELKNGCVNSFANLKPLCGPCNGRKSNFFANNDNAVDEMDEE